MIRVAIVAMPFVDGLTAARHIRQVEPAVTIIFITNLAHVEALRDRFAVVHGEEIPVSQSK